MLLLRTACCCLELWGFNSLRVLSACCRTCWFYNAEVFPWMLQSNCLSLEAEGTDYPSSGRCSSSHKVAAFHYSVWSEHTEKVLQLFNSLCCNGLGTWVCPCNPGLWKCKCNPSCFLFAIILNWNCRHPCSKTHRDVCFNNVCINNVHLSKSFPVFQFQAKSCWIFSMHNTEFPRATDMLMRR